MKHLYDSLRGCAKEEEVKAEFCKFFKMKIFALRGIDHYTERVLFEFKYDRNFRNQENVARTLAQVMYYARQLKFGAGLTKYPLPPWICVVDKNEAFFAETKDYARFYAAKGDRYDWDRAPSTPCPKLVGDILSSFVLKGNNTNNFEKQLSGEARANSPAQASSKTAAPVGAAENEKVVFTSCPGCFQIPYIYDLTNLAEEEQFAAKGLEYIERTVGREWWKRGNVRQWDMAAGTGNLEFKLPSSALRHCYIFTLEAEDAKYCQKIFPDATCFQYDYLADDIPALAGQMTFGQTRKMPPNLVADLAKKRYLAEQDITLDVFNADVEKVGTKRLPSVERTDMLNKWCPRPKWDGKSVMPTFVSAFNLKTDNKDKRNHVVPGFLCSVSSKSDDFQNQNSVFILSAPYANAGAFSVTPENFEKAMVLHAVKKIPKATWTNDRDAFYAPTGGPASVPTADGTEPVPPMGLSLPHEFVTDCVVWSAFADSNYAVSLRNVLLPVDVVVDRVNRLLKGWGAFYSVGYPSRAFRKVNHYVLKRMARFLNRKSQRYYRLRFADTYYGEMAHYGLYRLAWADVRRAR